MIKWVTRGNKNTEKQVFHTDKECPRLRSDPREVSDSEVDFHELTLCKWCSSDPSPDYSEQDHSYHKRALEADVSVERGT